MKKGQTRIDGVDDKIIGLYASGLSVRDIQAHLEDLYGLRVSPDLISRVTDAVLDEVGEWQLRGLDRMYPIVIFDALRVKIRDADSRMVKNKAVYIALGVTRDGEREVLGLWIADNEGAKFWLFGDERTAQSWGSGHPDLGRGRLEGLPGCHHGGLPGHHGSDLRSPLGSDQWRLQWLTSPDPAFHELLQLEGPQGRGRRSAPDLPGAHGR